MVFVFSFKTNIVYHWVYTNFRLWDRFRHIWFTKKKIIVYIFVDKSAQYSVLPNNSYKYIRSFQIKVTDCLMVNKIINLTITNQTKLLFMKILVKALAQTKYYNISFVALVLRVFSFHEEKLDRVTFHFYTSALTYTEKNIGPATL